MNDLQRRFQMKLANSPIRIWRQENSVTRAALASAVGVSMQSIAMFETGSMGLSEAVMQRLIDVTGKLDFPELIEIWRKASM